MNSKKNSFKKELATYKIGDRGEEIADIQRHLLKLSLKVGLSGVDGVFGKDTADAIAQFKAVNGLNADSIVDEKTWKLLVEQTYGIGERLLYLKSPNFRGKDVSDLQTNLNKLGFNVGEIDGIFGPKTDLALRDFQFNYGITADGILGPETIKAFTYLRMIFAANKNIKFPKLLEKKSIIRTLADKVIFIDIEAPLIEQDQDEGSILHLLCDIALRLGNLLEILNAKVNYSPLFNFEKFVFNDQSDFNLFEHKTDVTVDLKLTLGFGSNMEVGVSGAEINYSADDPLGKIFSEKIASEFQKNLNLKVRENPVTNLNKSEVNFVPFNLGNGKKSVDILLRPLFYGYNKNKLLLKKEEFRQKLAVTIFDAVKNCFAEIDTEQGKSEQNYRSI